MRSKCWSFLIVFASFEMDVDPMSFEIGGRNRLQEPVQEKLRRDIDLTQIAPPTPFMDLVGDMGGGSLEKNQKNFHP